MSQKLTKAQIIGELLAEEQISAEEAITLLSEKPTTIIYNVSVPEKKEMPRRKTSKKENESHPTLWELCVSGDVDMVREAVQRGDQVP